MPGSNGLWESDGGRTLGTTVEIKGCEAAHGEVPEQTPQRVVFRLAVVDTSGKGRMCPMTVRIVSVTVRLDEPLGSRPVLLTVKRQ